jgi:hypothetical protein
MRLAARAAGRQQQAMLAAALPERRVVRPDARAGFAYVFMQILGVALLAVIVGRISTTESQMNQVTEIIDIFGKGRFPKQQ